MYQFEISIVTERGGSHTAWTRAKMELTKYQLPRVAAQDGAGVHRPVEEREIGVKRGPAEPIRPCKSRQMQMI